MCPEAGELWSHWQPLGTLSRHQVLTLVLPHRARQGGPEPGTDAGTDAAAGAAGEGQGECRCVGASPGTQGWRWVQEVLWAGGTSLCGFACWLVVRRETRGLEAGATYTCPPSGAHEECRGCWGSMSLGRTP